MNFFLLSDVIFCGKKWILFSLNKNVIFENVFLLFCKRIIKNVSVILSSKKESYKVKGRPQVPSKNDYNECNS